MNLNDLIGKPFKDHGRGPADYDCYGLAMEVFRRFGIELIDFNGSCRDKQKIHNTYLEWRDQWKQVEGEPQVPSLLIMKANSAIFLNHVGVYLGDGKFIHSIDKKGVVIEETHHPFYRRVIAGYYIPKWVTK